MQRTIGQRIEIDPYEEGDYQWATIETLDPISARLDDGKLAMLDSFHNEWYVVLVY
jgi:hypothetical protein